ncbi:MAG TPA: hypothetical protein VEU75_08015 [Candidatus Acidoferrum sp.]|nr:hypothetical protein [Candidatus Acidoferrum sp.]
MRSAGRTRLLALTSLIALCAFTGDIIADSIADLRGDHCVSQSSQPDSQHDKSPCPHCSCAVHNGTVITSTVAVDISGAFGACIFFSTSQQSAPDGLPAAIDHPPQLA